MTRRRIIAGVILLAAVAVAVPFVPGVWERVAYTREYEPSSDVFYRLKRWSWLPGKTAILADQLCLDCVDEEHHWCTFRPGGDPNRVWLVGATHPRTGHPVAVWTRDFRCTCTAPSHDGDSDSE